MQTSVLEKALGPSTSATVALVLQVVKKADNFAPETIGGKGRVSFIY